MQPGTQIELFWPPQRKWSVGTIVKNMSGNQYQIQFDDDGFETPLTYNLDKYEWRLVGSGNQPMPTEELPEDVYEVESILDKRWQNGVAVYKVKWKGYPVEECTWEPIEHLDAAKNLVEALEVKLRTSGQSRKRAREDTNYIPRNSKRLAKTEPGYPPSISSGLPQYQPTPFVHPMTPFFWPMFPKHSKLDINDCQRWNEHEVLEWLDSMPGIGHIYKKMFWENAVDGRLLVEASYPVLFTELRIQQYHQIQFKTAIDVLKRAKPSAS